MAEETTEPIIEEAGEPQEQETVTLEDLDGEGRETKDTEGEADGQTDGEAKQEPEMKHIAELLLDIAGPEMAKKFAKDKAAQDAIAAGADPIKTFRSFRERSEKGAGKTGAPTTRQQGTGTTRKKSIAEMSDAEFAEFDRKVQRALMSGKRVRL